MTAGQLHRVVRAARSAARADAALVHAGLRDEPRERGIEIAGPLLVQLSLHLRWARLEARTAALAEAAIVDRQRADAGGAELPGDRLPRRARRNAHVHQDYGRTGPVGREVGRLQAGAVRRGDVDVAWCGLR